MLEVYAKNLNDLTLPEAKYYIVLGDTLCFRYFAKCTGLSRKRISLCRSHLAILFAALGLLWAPIFSGGSCRFI